MSRLYIGEVTDVHLVDDTAEVSFSGESNVPMASLTLNFVEGKEITCKVGKPMTSCKPKYMLVTELSDVEKIDRGSFWLTLKVFNYSFDMYVTILKQHN